MDADFLSNREQIGRVNEKLKTVHRNLHLIVNTFENQMGDTSADGTFLRFHKINILRADHNVDRFVFAESDINALELRTENLDETVLNHDAVENVAVTDEVCNECVLRFIVDVFRCADLLDITLVHDNDRVRHGKRLFLIVGDIDKGDTKLVFQTDQLVLHILTEL